MKCEESSLGVMEVISSSPHDIHLFMAVREIERRRKRESEREALSLSPLSVTFLSGLELPKSISFRQNVLFRNAALIIF